MSGPPAAGQSCLGWEEVTRQAGITYRQLDYWTRERCYLEAWGGGSGYDRQWPRSEVRIAVLMGRLVAAGLTPEAAHRVARSPVHELAPGIRITVVES